MNLSILGFKRKQFILVKYVFFLPRFLVKARFLVNCGFGENMVFGKNMVFGENRVFSENTGFFLMKKWFW